MVRTYDRLSQRIAALPEWRRRIASKIPPGDPSLLMYLAACESFQNDNNPRFTLLNNRKFPSGRRCDGPFCSGTRNGSFHPRHIRKPKFKGPSARAQGGTDPVPCDGACCQAHREFCSKECWAQFAILYQKEMAAIHNEYLDHYEAQFRAAVLHDPRLIAVIIQIIAKRGLEPAIEFLCSDQPLEQPAPKFAPTFTETPYIRTWRRRTG